MSREFQFFLGAIGVSLVLLAANTLGTLFWVAWGMALMAVAVPLYPVLSAAPVLLIFLRAGLALVPIGGVTGGLILWVFQVDGLEEVERRAIASGLVVAAGWVVAFVTSEWRRVSNEDERRRDLIAAAIAEVLIIERLAKSVTWQDVIEDVAQEFEKDRRYRAFVTYGHEYSTLKRLIDQVEVLKPAQIEPVIVLFQLLDRIDCMERHIMSDAFHALPWGRRQKGVERYLRLHGTVGKVAEKARLSLLNGAR